MPRWCGTHTIRRIRDPPKEVQPAIGHASRHRRRKGKTLKPGTYLLTITAGDVSVRTKVWVLAQ